MASGHRDGGVFASLWTTATRFNRAKVTPWIALRNTIGVAGPLAVGVLLGSTSAGLAVATGALNVSYSDSSEPYLRRARKMLAATVLVGLAVFLGGLSGQDTILAVAVAGGWAFGAGLMVALSGEAADVGAISLVTLIVYQSAPHPVETAIYGGLLALGGGLLQTGITAALWPFRRFMPERRVLAKLYAALSDAARNPGKATASPPASEAASTAQEAMAALLENRSIEAERIRALLNQAERIRLSLLMLSRVRTRLERDHSAVTPAELLDRCFVVSARVLADVADSLTTTAGPRHGAEKLQDLRHAAEQLRESAEEAHTARAMLRDGRRQIDALAGQLRSALDLATQVTPAGLTEFERREAARPWTLRLGGTLATLRANLHSRSAAFRHAARMAVCVAIGAAIGRGFGLERSYWLPMTIAIVLKPDFTATFSRGALRVAGTFVGLLIATVLFHLLAVTPMTEVALIAVFVFLTRCFGGANYGILVVAVTGLVVVLVAMTGISSPKDVIAARAVNTVWGGIIALLAYWLWPTWERHRVSEVLAQMLDSYRDYFHAIRMAYEQGGATPPPGLDRARLASRMARSNMEASLERMSAEPGSDPRSVNLLSRILSSSHRMVHAMMALEAGLSGSKPVSSRPAFTDFGNDVELMLYYIAAALRGSPIALDQLPDLRERHHALESEAGAAARHALVNIETDRITNSLDTVAENAFAWLADQANARNRAPERVTP